MLQQRMPGFSSTYLWNKEEFRNDINKGRTILHELQDIVIGKKVFHRPNRL